MDARYEITGTALPALPGSQPITDLLRAEQAPQLLRLGRRKSRRLRVVQGRLWLTQDGQHEDVLLSAGQPWLLQGPGQFRLGALGPEDCRFVWQPTRDA
jgi:hypothetical protein